MDLRELARFTWRRSSWLSLLSDIGLDQNTVVHVNALRSVDDIR